MMRGWGDGFGAAGGVILTIASLAVLALIVVGIILLVRGLTRRNQPTQAPAQTPSPPSGPGNAGKGQALSLLEERYARGEIDREEFLQRREDLLGHGRADR